MQHIKLKWADSAGRPRLDLSAQELRALQAETALEARALPPMRIVTTQPLTTKADRLDAMATQLVAAVTAAVDRRCAPLDRRIAALERKG